MSPSNNMKLKIITGFRKEQHYTIDGEEAHKAYYLFLNPDKRGIFDNGVALIGNQIQGIEPDYHATMGWNDTHVLDGDDWNEIRGKKIDIKFRELQSKAKEIATTMQNNPQIFSQPLTKIDLPKDDGINDITKLLSDKFKINE